MKIYTILFLCLLSILPFHAQDEHAPAKDIQLYNQEYDVFLKLDSGNEGLIVPGHDLYGPLPGYLGKTKNSFYWLILSVETKGDTKHLQLVNDYGSEDLTATLTQTSDSTFLFTQRKGSTLKLPQQGKWQKMPKTLPFQIIRKTGQTRY